MNTEKAFNLFAEGSPVTHLTAADPPVFLYYTFLNQPPSPDMPPAEGIHHPRFGVYLKECMDKLGIECSEKGDRRIFPAPEVPSNPGVPAARKMRLSPFSVNEDSPTVDAIHC